MTSEIKQLHEEVKMMRRDLKKIKVMLVPEVTPTKKEIKAIEQGRKEYAHGNYIELKDYTKGRSKRAVS